MSAIVMSVPADRMDWGPLQKGAGWCFQTAQIFEADRLLFQITVQWPGLAPTVPVVSVVDNRHGGPRD